MDRLPLRLENDPILEALFEVRFQNSENVPVSELLPGMLFPQVKGELPTLQALFPPQIPREIIRKDPNLQYSASHRMSGKQFSVSIGERVFSVSCSAPYVGWPSFKSKILTYVRMLKDTGLANEIGRFSLKYINFISIDDFEQPYDALSASLNLGGYDLTKLNAQVTTEILEGDCLNIVKILPNVLVELAGSKEPKHGLILDVDSIYEDPGMPFWENLESLIDSVRSVEKHIFFSLLSENGLQKFKPVWSES